MLPRNLIRRPDTVFRLGLAQILVTARGADSLTLRRAIKNDDRNLYLALEWDDDTLNTFDPSLPSIPSDFDGIALASESSEALLPFEPAQMQPPGCNCP